LYDLIKYDPHAYASQADYLFQYVSFYRGLSEKGKLKFLHRVRKFIRSKDFEFFFEAGREELLVKTLIAASCVQLTWGIKDKYISSYTYIGVYADALKLQKGKGVTYSSIWLTKNIHFSWSKIKEGFEIPDDSKHIGLFEWTRALIIQAKKDNILDDFFTSYYKVWCEAARDIMFVVDEDENLPLDKFGQKLPVIVQHFFETPEELRQNHPEMYEHTKRLLNLDLLEAAEYDYIYSKKLAAEKKLLSDNRVLVFGVQNEIRKFGLTSGVMYYILAQFPAVVLIWYTMGRWTYASWSFNLCFIVFLLIGLGVIYKRYYLKRGLGKKAAVIISLVGLIPFVYGSMCLLNYSISLEQHTRPVVASRPAMLDLYLPWKGFTEPHIKAVHLPREETMDTTASSGNVMSQMRKTYTQNIEMKNLLFLLDGNDKVELHTRKGLFGAEVFDGYVITIKE
jgi:hypothetical protein